MDKYYIQVGTEPMLNEHGQQYGTTHLLKEVPAGTPNSFPKNHAAYELWGAAERPRDVWDQRQYRILTDEEAAEFEKGEEYVADRMIDELKSNPHQD